MRARETFTARLSRRAAALARTHHVAVDPGRRPIASFTFDDCPHSAATTGASIVEQHGARATFYVCGGLENRQWENGRQFTFETVRALAAHGHEVGCHTFGHVDCSALGRAALRQEFARNRAYFERRLGIAAARSFAYPYGNFSLTSKLTTRAEFGSCRGVWPGVNSGRIDLALLRANPVPRTGQDLHEVTALIEASLRTGGWLIFYSHDVDAAPTAFGCRPDALAATLAAVRAAGIDILPVGDAVARLRHPTTV
jgi:peptidoglycan/xylan/chitin deacetylase (PgdA/CDA1 family)